MTPENSSEPECKSSANEPMERPVWMGLLDEEARAEKDAERLHLDALREFAW